MLNGRRKGALIGTGTVLWRARELLAAGEINDEEFRDMVTAGYVKVLYAQLVLTDKTEELPQRDTATPWERPHP